jgi:valyl-tRNA synthetase
MELPDRYNPKESEKKWQEYWGKNKIYEFDIKDGDKEIYSIDTPPPTVSGKMHIGHAFSYSQQDFIARYKRMAGFNVFYPFGTDDNGLATIKLVQKKKKANLKTMDRDDAIKICLEYLDEERPKFIQDWKNIGMSCDFNLRYSTIDEHSRKISQRTFLELVKKNLAYRKEAPVIWDTQFQTAIAQAELEDKEMPSFFNDLTFKTEDNEDLIIATTRPELLGACVAVFVHPDDKKYKKYVGKNVITPIYNHKVPIIADNKVDMEKGTGVVMCCTFGDQTDMEWYKQYNLPLKMVITPWGKMNESAGKYEKLSIVDARKAIIEDLKESGLLLNQKAINHVVQVGERSGRPVEIINSKQWYISYLDKKEELLKKGDELNWYPKHMKHRLDNWIKGLNWDWSISRQRNFGVPIPVWYDKEGKIYYADESQLPVDPTKDRPKGVSDDVELIPEKDVFDTWFTSGSSPQLAIELLPKDIQKKVFPMNLRPQAHDIINFWLFYTMAKSNLIYDKNPWTDTIIMGWALDPHGKKMSKSKGNVVAPQDMIEKYSADALRFWSAGSKLGDDMPFQEKDLKTGKKTVTKLWNASKFALTFLEDYEFEKHDLEVVDKWMLTKLQNTIKQATEHFDKYEYSKVKKVLDEFFWQVLCDNYLEFVKDRLYNPNLYHKGAKNSAQFGLYEAVLNVLKMFAPLMPYITEEVYSLYFKDKENKESIHISNWPKYNENYVDKNSEFVGDLMVDIVQRVRKFKSEKQISLKEDLSKIIIKCSEKDRKLLELIIQDIKAVTKVKDIEFDKGEFDIIIEQ